MMSQVRQDRSEAVDWLSLMAERGITGALVGATDWSSTALGPVESWPGSLKTTVSTLLYSRHPMFLWWGPELVQIYNDAYLPSFGRGKHPAAMGQRGADCWGEIWPIIWPQIDAVMRHATSSWNEDHLVPIFRNGRIEEVYWTYGYSPVFREDGRVGGTLVVCTETTSRVVAQRRQRTLQALRETIEHEVDADAVMRGAAQVLSTARHDVPFALLYLRDGTGEVRQAGGAGIEAPAGAEGAVSVSPRLTACVEQVLKDRQPLCLSTTEVALDMPLGPWPEPVESLWILPLVTSLGDTTTGCLVLGTSPRLPFDEAYRDHFNQLASQLASVLAVKRSHSLAETARQDLYDFFMQAPAPLCILLGPEHVFALANGSYLELVGRDVVGKPVRAAFSFEEGGHFFHLLDGVYRTGVPYIGQELPFRRPNAQGVMTDHLLNIGYHPFRTADGHIKGVLAFVQDVTETVMARRRAETLAADLRTAVSARDTFLGIASHELKTPLTSLKLQTQSHQRALARSSTQTWGPEKIHRVLETTARQITRLTRLVDDMLDISRIATGNLAMNLERVSLSSLVKDTAERLLPELAAVGSELKLDLEPDIQGEWDPYRLEQVLTNLLTNALRYAPGAPIHIRLREQEGQVVLSVRDHGPGIAPSSLERIFKRFERLQTPNVGGLGLGLNICQHIIQAHGGSIRAESTLGQGACFIVELPVYASA